MRLIGLALALCLALAPLAVEAQQPGKVYRIGVLPPDGLEHRLDQGGSAALLWCGPQGRAATCNGICR